jgi:surface polysaccharide O-acyltransferase-like enzyme
MTKQRFYAFDIIRTIAAYAVIIVHVTAIAYTLYDRDSFQLLAVSVINRTFKFTTPVFIFLGGLMVNLKYKDSAFKIRPFYLDRFKRIYVPYLIFSLLYMLSHVLLFGSKYAPDLILEHLVYGSAKYHLYFVIIISQLYLITPLLIKLKTTKHKHTIALITLIINLWAIVYLVFPYSDRFFLKYAFPYLVGLLYGTELSTFLKSLTVKRAVVLTTVLTGVIYAGSFYYQTIGTKGYSPEFQILIWFIYTNLCVYSLIILAHWLEKNTWLRDKAVSITQYSFFIYLIHPLVLDGNERLLNTAGLHSVTLRLALNLAVTLVLSTILSKWLKKLFSFLRLA